MSAPVDDDAAYSAELSVDSGSANHTWAEIYLDNVDQSAEGPRRVEKAQAVVRMWFGDDHFDVPYAELVALLDAARTRLLVGESHVPVE